VLGEVLGLLLGKVLGEVLGTVLGLVLGKVLGAVLGEVLGLSLCRPVVSTLQAVSQVTAVWAMARPIIFPLVPIVIADPASTLPTKVLLAPRVKPVPRIQYTLSGLAPFSSTMLLPEHMVRVEPTLKINSASELPSASR
jgi:hypothetical protein